MQCDHWNKITTCVSTKHLYKAIHRYAMFAIFTFFSIYSRPHPSNPQHAASWSLPEKGFNALCDVEKSIVPGLPALARDMATDGNCLADDANNLSAETLSSRLGAQGRPYVVVAHTSGIHVYSGVFTRISHHHAAAAVATRRRAMTVARLEKAEAGINGTGTRQRFVLEDYEYGVGFSWGRGHHKRVERTKRRGRIGGGSRAISLPVTYARLLDEARSWRPTGRLGNKLLAGGTLRWPLGKGRRSKTASSRVVPGLVGEFVDEETEKRQPSGPSLVRRDRIGLTGERQNARTQDSENGGCDGERERDSPGNLPQLELAQHPQPLTSCCVEAASLATATSWASTPELLLALLAAACSTCEEGHHHDRAEQEAPKSAKGEGAAGEQARLAACSLLLKVFGTACSEDVIGQTDRGRRTKGDEHAALLDMWYDSFWRIAVPFAKAAGEGDQGAAVALQDTPRLLLEGMLGLAEVRRGFLRRGLLQRLTKGLPSRGASWRGVQDQGIASGRVCGSSPSSVLQQTPEHASDISEVLGSGREWNTVDGAAHDDPCSAAARGTAAKHDIAEENSPFIVVGSSEAYHHHYHGVPWWLFHAGGGGEGEGEGGEGGGGGGAANETTCEDYHHGSADGDTRGSTEADESCNTASDGEYVLGESVPQTSRDDGPTDDNDIAEIRGVSIKLCYGFVVWNITGLGILRPTKSGNCAYYAIACMSFRFPPRISAGSFKCTNIFLYFVCQETQREASHFYHPLPPCILAREKSAHRSVPINHRWDARSKVNG